MQAQLEALEKDAGIEWREYAIGELFDVGTGSLVDVKSAEHGRVPRVSVQTTDNGIFGYYDEPLENARYFTNFISINFFGISYYHPYRASVEMKVHTLKIPKHEFTRAQGVFISTAINKRFNGVYSYGSQLSSSKLKNDGFKIQLPTILENDKPKIAFDFIEKFVATLHAERVATLHAYLKTTALSSYTLTAEEQTALDGLNKVTWGQFKIDDVFEKLNLKNHNESFDKLLDTSKTQTAEFNLPLVNAKLGNNGIMFYGRDSDFDSAEMVIDVVSNGAVATGTVYAQPHKVGVLWDAYLLKAKVQDMNKQKLLFLSTALQKSIKTKFGWEDKAVWSKVQHEMVSLPINPDQTPNDAHMSLVISAMQKVVIKNVVDALDVRIEKTGETLH